MRPSMHPPSARSFAPISNRYAWFATPITQCRVAKRQDETAAQILDHGACLLAGNSCAFRNALNYVCTLGDRCDGLCKLGRLARRDLKATGDFANRGILFLHGGGHRCVRLPDMAHAGADRLDHQAGICRGFPDLSDVTCYYLGQGFGLVCQAFHLGRHMAKPLPASPARAASIVALRASRLVRPAMSEMARIMSPMARAACVSAFTVSAASPTAHGRADIIGGSRSLGRDLPPGRRELLHCGGDAGDVPVHEGGGDGKTLCFAGDALGVRCHGGAVANRLRVLHREFINGAVDIQFDGAAGIGGHLLRQSRGILVRSVGWDYGIEQIGLDCATCSNAGLRRNHIK